MARDDTQKVAELELELLRAQRVQLASRLTTPWWYVAGLAFAWAVAFALPIANHYRTISTPGVYPLGGLLIIVVVLPLQYALTRVSGLEFRTRNRQYPSARPWTIAIPVLILTASRAEKSLLDHGLPAAAIVVGVLAALAGVGCWQGQLRAIRRDLATGTGAR